MRTSATKIIVPSGTNLVVVVSHSLLDDLLLLGDVVSCDVTMIQP
jgi:hypothetical protein